MGVTEMTSLLENVSYEIMPFKKTGDRVRAHLSREVPLTITATGGKGLEPTLELAEDLASFGYTVAPHIPARLVRDRSELESIASRMERARVSRAFIVAGDAEEHGAFPDSLSLLETLETMTHPFEWIGIGGYPEGHASFDTAVIDEALRKKAPKASRVLTQICFDAEVLLRWGSQIRSEGVELPISVGIPGPVQRQKLLRISASLGLGQSAAFLKKQQNMFWKFFTPSGYRPTKLLRGLSKGLPTSDANITGLHVFTFNELESVERWRQEQLRTAGVA